MKYFITCFALLFLSLSIAGQSTREPASLNVTFAAASAQGTAAASIVHNWKLGTRKRIIVGVGGRFTGYFGQRQYYATAPAALTSGDKGPHVIFKENIVANMDSVFIAKPAVFAINALINLGYQCNEKLSIGFNIDAIGFSFGKRTNGTYINGSQAQSTSARPSGFNLLLVSDNDLGSLNSELYGRYQLNDRIGIRSGFQFLFTEYKTSTNVQQFPEPNDRFRRKSLMFMVGMSFNLSAWRFNRD